MNMQGQPREWTYEELCDYCREASAEIDNRRWLIGDTALTIEKHYGQHTADDFAKDIGQNKSTVSGWKRVSRFYPNNIRADLFAEMPNLTYTFYRDAMRLEGIDPAIEWLQDCSEFGYSADEASRKLTEKLGHKTHESAEGTIFSYAGQIDGKFIIEIAISEDDAKWLKDADKVTIRAK